MNYLIGTLLVIHVIVSILLLLLVLMQRPRSEGLGTAFGGAVTDTLFGSNTGNVLTKITSWFGFLFFALTIVLACLFSRLNTAGKLSDKLKVEEVPPAAAATLPETTASTPVSPEDAKNSSETTVTIPPAAEGVKPTAATPDQEGAPGAAQPEAKPAKATSKK